MVQLQDTEKTKIEEPVLDVKIKHEPCQSVIDVKTEGKEYDLRYSIKKRSEEDFEKLQKAKEPQKQPKQ